MSGSDQQQQGGSQYPSFPVIKWAGFTTLNTNASRPSIKRDEMAWADGFMPIGESQLRTMPDAGTAVFPTPGGTTIAFFTSCNIGPTSYLLVFPSDGSIYAQDISTNAITGIAGAGTITTTINQRHVGIAQWGPQYLIIVSDQADGYWIWDGVTFYPPGASVPGFGTVPTGIQGGAVETYQSRVWVTSDSTCFFSAPGSITDFTTASGGGDFSSEDSFLKVKFIQPRQTNGFLYLVADSSINYISNVQTSGSPPVTTFTNQNANPEVGTDWPSTVQTWGNSILLVNSYGVHISYGGQVSKISEALDGIYYQAQGAISLDNNFSATKAVVFGKKLFLLLAPIINPISGATENKLFCWDGKAWWAASQTPTLTYIAGLENNTIFTAYGTDGSFIYQLFKTAGSGTQKVVQSKLWDEPGGIHLLKSMERVWLLAQYGSNVSPNLIVEADNETNTGPTVTFTPSSFTGYYASPPTAISQNGRILGLTITTNAADVTLIAASFDANIIEYLG